jgi:hypothetical protein
MARIEISDAEAFRRAERANQMALTMHENGLSIVVKAYAESTAAPRYVNKGGVYVMYYLDGTSKKVRVERIRNAETVVIRGFNKGRGEWQKSTKSESVRSLAMLAGLSFAPKLTETH